MEDIQEQLKASPLDGELHSLEKEVSFNLQKWQSIDLDTLRQKSEIRWLKEGDSNTRYFHSVVKHRTSHNRIDFLKNGDGELEVDKRKIAAMISDFYKDLLGSSADTLVGIDIQAMRNCPQLSHAQAIGLIQPISQDEVVAALHAIDDTKSPELDGFSSLFFKKSWHIIKHDVLEAVNVFSLMMFSFPLST